MKIGLIGYGTIGDMVMRGLEEDGGDTQVVGILARAHAVPSIRQKVPPHVTVTSTFDAFAALRPDAVVECAGSGALKEHGARCLNAGFDLLVGSVGALAERQLEEALRVAAIDGGRLMIPSGTMAGLDSLCAARRSWVDRVRYVARKAPMAWKSTAAAGMVDLARILLPTSFCHCNARQAALTFPEHADMVAAVALAGIGFDRTDVLLMADPDAIGERHVLEASGDFGEMMVSMQTRPVQGEAGTSLLTPYSLLRAIFNLNERVVV